MSAPPPHVIAPVEDIPAAPATAEAPEPAATVPASPTASRPPRPQPKPEPPPAATAQPPTPPPVTTPPPLEVRSVPSAAAAAEEKKVREVMQRAANDLSRVTWQRLSAERKEQYSQSQRFAEQAEQALKEKNFVYAMALAERAATLAAELAGR